MIHVRREPEPPSLINNAANWTSELCEHWRAYYGSGEPGKPPRAKKSRYAGAEVKHALKRMFDGKCCYCEGKVNVVSHQHVEHYRPQSIYPRLAYVWSNLLLACEQCNSTYKGDRFQVGPHEHQVKPNKSAPCSLDDSDDGLLLNPCLDDPEDHFIYEFDDRREEHKVDVVLVCKTRRGEVSREICGLDRESLVDDWREHILDLQDTIRLYELAYTSRDIQKYRARLLQKMDASSKYSALTRAYISSRGIDL